MTYPNPKPPAINWTKPPPALGDSANKRPRRRKKYTLPLVRLRDLVVLAESRLRRDLPIDPEAILRVAAFSLASLEGMLQRSGNQHDGLDMLTARQFARRASIDIDEQSLWRIVRDAAECLSAPNSPFRMNATLAGHLIQITREERANLELWSMEAIDEPAAARRARKAREKRLRDRERQRRVRAAQATAMSPQPASNEQAQPWKAEGISRRTWYRRRAKARDETRSEHQAPDTGGASGTDFVADLSYKPLRDTFSATSVMSASLCRETASAIPLPFPPPRLQLLPRSVRNSLPQTGGGEWISDAFSGASTLVEMKRTPPTAAAHAVQPQKQGEAR